MHELPVGPGNSGLPVRPLSKQVERAGGPLHGLSLDNLHSLLWGLANGGFPTLNWYQKWKWKKMINRRIRELMK